MIKTFSDKQTAAVFQGVFVKKFAADMQQAAREKLKMLDAATKLETLLIPPSNRLEKLKGDRKGQHSIRINSQFRICFVWKDGHALDVEIVDYH